MNPATKNYTNSALLVIDMINDFADPKGALYVKGGETIVNTINALMSVFKDNGGKVIAVNDSHPTGHMSFASRYGVAPFSPSPINPDTLVRPDHAVQGTRGAEFIEGLKTELIDVIVTK